MYSKETSWRAPGNRLRLRIRVSLLVCALVATAVPLPGTASVQSLPKHQLAGAYSCNPGIANYSCSWQINESYSTAGAGGCNMGFIDIYTGQWVTDYYSCSLWGSGGYYKSLPMVFFCYRGNCGAYPAGIMQLYSNQSGWTYTYCTDFGAFMNSSASEGYKWSGTGGNRTWYIASAFGASNPSSSMRAGTYPANWAVGRDMFAGAQAAIWALLGVTVNSIRTWNGSSWVNDGAAMGYYNAALADSNSYAFVPYGTQANRDQYYLSLSTNSVTTQTPPVQQTVTATWHAMWPDGLPQAGEAVTLTVQQAGTDASFAGGSLTASGTTDSFGNFSAPLTVSQGPAGAINKVNIVAASSTANIVNAGFSENGNQILIDAASGLHRNDNNQQTQTLDVTVPVKLGAPSWPAGQIGTIPGPNYGSPGSLHTYVNIPTCVGVSQAYQPSGFSPPAPPGFQFKVTLTPDPNDPSFYLDFGDGNGSFPFTYDAGNLVAGQLANQPRYLGNNSWDVSRIYGVDTACKTPAYFYGKVFPDNNPASIKATQRLLYTECAVDANGNPPFGVPDCTAPTPVTFNATTTIAVYQIEGIPYVQ